VSYAYVEFDPEIDAVTVVYNEINEIAAVTVVYNKINTNGQIL